MLKELINQEGFSITTERLRILPLSDKYEYINEYFEEFTTEITRYQYPDPFRDIDAVKDFFDQMIQCRKEGMHLCCIVIDMNGNFIGAVDAYGINTAAPELGLWIAKKYQLKGFGYEAITGMIDFIRSNQKIDFFVYEADCRNAASTKLINKLKGEKHKHEHVVTESGKELELDMYYIK